MSMCCISEC